MFDKKIEKRFGEEQLLQKVNIKKIKIVSSPWLWVTEELFKLTSEMPALKKIHVNQDILTK